MPTFTGTERYELLRTLGQGGMGTVYSVYDRRRQRKLALKILSDPDVGSLFRFKREFRAVADLRHPHLIRLYDLGILPGGGFFFTMELVEGQDLGAWVRRRPQEVGVTVKALAETVDESRTQTWAEPTPDKEHRRASDDEIARVLTGLVSGLAHLHSTRKVHRDLKPTNVMVDESGQARLLDFGILRELDREGMTGGGAVGTPLYMAPEQVTGDEVTPATDLYALGCMLYQLLTGAPPFQGKPATVLMRHLREAPVAPSRLRPGCDERLEQLCLQLLAKEPAERPLTADVLDDLWAIAGGRPDDMGSTGDLTPLRVPDLVGRETELAELKRAWTDAHEGPRVVLIAGESGAGKSALATEFAQQMSGEVRAWFGGCYEREHVPYKAFDAIVDAVAVDLAQRGDDAFRLLPPGIQALTRMFPVLREVPAVQQLDPDTPLRDARAERQRAGRAFFALLSNLSGGLPPLLVIDDLQRSDAESLEVIKWLPDLPDPPRCLIVGTYRSEEVDAEHGLQEVLSSNHRGVTKLEVPPLGREACDQLAQACATSPLSETQLRRLSEDAQGNPFLVVELARAAGELDGEALPTVAELVRGRLAKLGEQARSVLEAAAVAGGRASFDMLAAASGGDPAEVALAVDELLRVQLLREVQGHHGEDAYDLIHDKLRAAVYDEVNATRCRDLHRVLAEQLGKIDDAARAVEHWRLAGDPLRAREAALTAATLAEGQLAFDRAAELYALAGADEESWTLLVSLARALAKAGRHREAADAFERAARVAPTDSARDLWLTAATERVASGDIAEGMAGLDRLLREQGTQIKRNFIVSVIALVWRTVLLSAGWFVSDLITRFAPSLRRTRSERPDAETEYRLRLFDTAHHYLAVARPVEAARFGVRHALMSRRYADPIYEGRARIGYALFLVGDLGVIGARRAYHHLTVGEALCAEAKDAQGLLRAHWTRAFIYLLQSNWDGIRHVTAEADQLARKAGLYGDPTLMLLQNVHLLAELYRGDLPVLIRHARSYLVGARVRGSTWGLAWPLAFLGYALLLQGDQDEARAVLKEAIEVTPAEPLTLMRVHIELQNMALHLVDDQGAAGLEALADLNRRWRCSGLIASAIEDATYRMVLARLRLLDARSGGKPGHCRLTEGMRQVLPTPSSIRDEMLRLEAAVAFMHGNHLTAIRKLDRGIYAAEQRGNQLSLGLLRVARGRVRETLGQPGANHDRERGLALLRPLGADECYLLEAEGWNVETPTPKACPI